MLLKTKSFRTSVCERHEFEPVVQNGLAMTPSEMNELRRQGIAISAQNAQMLNEIDPADKDLYVPLQYRRGFDISDLSNHAADVREKLRDSIKKYDKGEIPDAAPKDE